MKLRASLGLDGAVLAAALSAKDLAVCPLLTDHGILQRDTVVAVWGAARPDATVSVVFCDAKAEAAASAGY